MAAERTCKYFQRSLKCNSGLGIGLAARGQVSGDSQTHELRGNEGATDDQIDTAATQRNGAQQAAHVFAIFGSLGRHSPLLIALGQKVDVTAHGAGASWRRIQLARIEFIWFEVRPYVTF